jgi:hypothetical protein
VNLTLPPGRPLPSACAHAQALARRTSWWLPGDLAASASSPPGKKNSRGAARLRQIELGYNLLQQVRHDVTGCRRSYTAAPVRRGRRDTVPRCVLSARGLPRRQPRQTPSDEGYPRCPSRISVRNAFTRIPPVAANGARERARIDHEAVSRAGSIGPASPGGPIVGAATDGRHSDYADGEIRSHADRRHADSIRVSRR